MPSTRTYKKELYSLPADVAQRLKHYARTTQRKKSHIVAEAIDAYIREHTMKTTPNEALTLIGMLNHQTPDIQEIKAHRDDL